MTNDEMRRIAKMQAEYMVEALKHDDELLDMVFPPRYMDVLEAADFLKVPVSTLYAKAGEIPHTKCGKRLLFTDRALTRWLKGKNTDSSDVALVQELRKVM